MGKRKAKSGGTQHSVTRLGHDMLGSVLALSETQQRLVLFVVCMYQQGARLDNRVVCRVSDIHQVVGGSRDEIYRTLRDHAVAIKKGTVYCEGPADPKTGDSIVSDLFQDIEIKPGTGEFTAVLSEISIRLLDKAKARFILVHLANIKRLRGMRPISLYMILAQWDSVGICTIEGAELAAKMRLEPSLSPFGQMMIKVVTPSISKISSILDVKIAVEVEGRGSKGRIQFSWRPNALREAAGDAAQPDLPGIDLNPTEEELAFEVLTAKVRCAGVADSRVWTYWLSLVSMAEAGKIVDDALRDGLKGAVLRDRIIARVSELVASRKMRQGEAAARAAERDGETARAAMESKIAALAELAEPGRPMEEAYKTWLVQLGEFGREQAQNDPFAWRRYWAKDHLNQGEQVAPPVEVTATPVEEDGALKLMESICANMTDENLRQILVWFHDDGIPAPDPDTPASEVRELLRQDRSLYGLVATRYLLTGSPPSEPPRRRGRPRKADR